TSERAVNIPIGKITLHGDLSVPRGSGGTLRSPCSVIFPIGMLTARSLVLICHSSYRRRISLRQLARFPLAGSLQRLHGAGFVYMNHRVELLRQTRFEVVAHALGFRQIDHADGALQPFL